MRNYSLGALLAVATPRVEISFQKRSSRETERERRGFVMKKEPGSSAQGLACLSFRWHARIPRVSSTPRFFFSGTFPRLLSSGVRSRTMCVFSSLGDERVAKNSNPATPPPFLLCALQRLFWSGHSRAADFLRFLCIVRLSLFSFLSTARFTVIMRITTIIFVNSRHVHPDRTMHEKKRHWALAHSHLSDYENQRKKKCAKIVSSHLFLTICGSYMIFPLPFASCYCT